MQQNQKVPIVLGMNQLMMVRFLKRFSMIYLVALMLHQTAYSQSKKIFYTSFDPVAGYEDSLHFTLLKSRFYSYQDISIGSSSYYIFGASNLKENAVLKNPYLVDSLRYKNMPNNTDYMFLLQQDPISTTKKAYFFQLNFAHLKTGEEVLIKISYEDVQKSNPDCIGHSMPLAVYNNGYQPLKLVNMGEKGVWVYRDTIKSGFPSYSLYLDSTDRYACNAIALKDVEVFAQPIVKAVSTLGTNLLINKDSTFLQAATNLTGNFIWQQKKGNQWITIGTNAKQLIAPKEEGEYSYRFLLANPNLDTLMSDTLILKAKALCNTKEQVLFYDNFGRLDAQDHSGNSYYIWDYQNPSKPVEIKKTSTTAFRWPSEHVRNTIFDGKGAMEDGYYTVASYLTSFSPYNGLAGSMLEWAHNIGGRSNFALINYDRSNNVNGGVLLMNWQPIKGLVGYAKTLNSLCGLTKINAEGWINVFTDGSEVGVNVNFKLTDLADTTNFQMVNGQSIQFENGSSWIPVRVSLTLSELSTSAKFEIINNGGTSIYGNDMALDDVRIIACNSCDVTNVEEHNINKQDFVYPNPTSNSLNLKSEVKNASVFNAVGAWVQDLKNAHNDISHWHPGLYFVVYTQMDGKTFTQKIIKQ